MALLRNAEVGFLDGVNAIDLSDCNETTRRNQVVSDSVRYFGPDAAQRIGYVEKDWIKGPWSRGGYVAHMSPGVMTQFGSRLREPGGRIHRAGTETASEWAGHREGACSRVSGSRGECRRRRANGAAPAGC